MQAVDHWAAGTTQPLNKPPLTQLQLRKQHTAPQLADASLGTDLTTHCFCQHHATLAALHAPLLI